ncbi:MAG: M16 family metallopeptidase, partial [Hyphomicrobiales bacterium]
MHRRPLHLARRAAIALTAAVALAASPLAGVLAPPAALAASPVSQPVVKEVLPDGLTLLMQEDHSKPIVGVCIFVKGGSRTEDPTLSGLSHYYEHLIFRGGSVRQDELEFRKQMQRIGEESGGYTTNDYTCYGFTAPTENLDEALWRSVDAWMGLKLTQAKVDKERQVVMEEYNQGEDRPDYKVYYQIERLLFHDHPYKRDTIGLKDVIEHASLATFRTFYAERYVPNQMILSVVGDFDPKAMHTKIERAFAPYPRGKASFEQGIVEKPQTAFRMGVESVKTPNTWTILGFHMPPYDGADTPALTVLASLLGHGSSSRLYHALKDKENLVTDVSADFEVRKDPGMFTINVQMPPANEAKVFGIVRDELTRLANEPVPAAELDRVKTSLVNDYAFAAQTPFDRAERLCLAGLMTDPSMVALWPGLIRSVSSDDIRRVVRTYFGPEQAAYSVVRPEGTAGGPSEADVTAMVDAWKTAWPAGATASSEAAAAPRREVLANGVTLLLREDHSSPIVAVATLARGGQWIEPDGKSGVSNMTATLLRRGAGGLTAREISDRAASLGMRLATGGSADYASVSWQAPSSSFDKAWDLYRAVLTQPTFPVTEVTKVRQDLTQQVKSLGDRPFEFTNVRFAEALYKNEPYRRAVIGDEKSLAAITTADLKAAYAKMFCGANLVVSVAGDIDADAVLALAKKTLGSLPKGAPVMVGGAEDQAPTATNATFVPKDQEQITYNTGWLGCSVTDPDYPALRTGVSLIGDRLFFKYVYEKGVAYRSWFYMQDRLGQASVRNEMGVTPSNWDMASNGVLADVASFVKGPISEADVKTTKDKIVSQYYLGAQTDAEQAARLAFYEMAGLGYQYADRYPDVIRKVTVADV